MTATAVGMTYLELIARIMDSAAQRVRPRNAVSAVDATVGATHDALLRGRCGERAPCE